MIFTVEVKHAENGEPTVTIHLDEEGYRDLLRQLARLQPEDHVHLFTEEWGGYPLTSTPISAGSRIAQMLTINRLQR